MDIKWYRFIGIVGLFALMGACSEQAEPVEKVTTGFDPPPLGSWIMYGGGQGELKQEILEREETVLVLADSTYSLTFQRPGDHFIFVESGNVYYDLRGHVARFTVMSVSAMDWSTGEPRKLVLIPETVPFQRDPGTAYGMEYSVQDSLMALTGSGHEVSWFLKTPH